MEKRCVNCECTLEFKNVFKYDGFCSEECREDFVQRVRVDKKMVHDGI